MHEEAPTWLHVIAQEILYKFSWFYLKGQQYLFTHVMSVTASVRLQIYAAKAKSYEHGVLQYHRGTDRLRIWEWWAQAILITQTL